MRTRSLARQEREPLAVLISSDNRTIVPGSICRLLQYLDGGLGNSVFIAYAVRSQNPLFFARGELPAPGFSAHPAQAARAVPIPGNLLKIDVDT